MAHLSYYVSDEAYQRACDRHYKRKSYTDDGAVIIDAEFTEIKTDAPRIESKGEQQP